MTCIFMIRVVVTRVHSTGKVYELDTWDTVLFPIYVILP